MPRALVHAALAILVLAASFTAAGTRADDTDPRQMVEALNTQRSALGLGPLQPNLRLETEAQFLAERLAASNSLRIDLDALQQRLKSAGYPYRRIASVAASGTSRSAEALRHFMARVDAGNDVLSPDYSEIGVGQANRRSGGSGSFWVVTIAHPIQQADPGWQRRLLEHVNDYRRRNGLDPLARSDILNDMAQRHSDDMAERDFFGHDTPDGITVADRALAAGYKYGVISENLAAGLRRPEAVVRGWIRSEPHRLAMLDENITEAGAGYTFVPFDEGRIGSVHYWTLNMGRPRTSRR